MIVRTHAREIIIFQARKIITTRPRASPKAFGDIEGAYKITPDDIALGIDVLVKDDIVVKDWSSATTNHQMELEKRDCAADLLITTTYSDFGTQKIIVRELQRLADACDNFASLCFRVELFL